LQVRIPLPEDDYFRFIAVVYGLLAALGLIPALNINHTFALIPIGENDVWLHALIAAAAAFFGWGQRAANATA
jgi:hypothetical protein